MNCAGCHGYGGERRDGSEPDRHLVALRRHAGEIFKSIYEGRPQGMPAVEPGAATRRRCGSWSLTYSRWAAPTSAAQSQAAVQGDRVGETSHLEVTTTLAGPAATLGPAARNEQGRFRARHGGATRRRRARAPQGAKP